MQRNHVQPNGGQQLSCNLASLAQRTEATRPRPSGLTFRNDVPYGRPCAPTEKRIGPPFSGAVRCRVPLGAVGARRQLCANRWRLRADGRRLKWRFCLARQLKSIRAPASTVKPPFWWTNRSWGYGDRGREVWSLRECLCLCLSAPHIQRVIQKDIRRVTPSDPDLMPPRHPRTHTPTRRTFLRTGNSLPWRGLPGVPWRSQTRAFLLLGNPNLECCRTMLRLAAGG